MWLKSCINSDMYYMLYEVNLVCDIITNNLQVLLLIHLNYIYFN